jgi:alkanesulfonate monooxygenase SsuD/methylene tetrahydromethanopterin reductase-like flavin-dependent oxidoreductase (luciferase family)
VPPLPLGLALGGAGRPEAHAERRAFVDRAEALGLHSVWLPEHHFAPGAVPSPLVVLAAFAARTRRLRLATTSLLVSIHHPLRVAEEVSVLDALSRGRVWLGVGRGFRTPLFAGFGVEARAKRDRFDEALDALIAAWSGEPLVLDGRHFDTGGREVRAALRPVQRPHPPLLVAAFGRKGLRQAARRGLPYLASPLEPLDLLVENHAFHREELARPLAGDGAKAPVMRTVHVAGDDLEAARVHAGLEAEASRRPPGRLPPALARAAAGGVDDRAIVGTRERVADRIALYRERVGMDLLVARTAVPGADAAAQAASLERLAELCAAAP